MNRFAALLDRLAYEPSRNAKLRLLTDYFRRVPDPDRGYALAAITGALSFRHAKPGVIRALIAERADPMLFELSYDYVGDLSETVALMWPAPSVPLSHDAATRLSSPLSPRSGGGERTAFAAAPTPSLSTVVTTLATLGKTELPRQLGVWLDALDETGRWALLKLVTGALRIGVSARLAKTAVAALGDKTPDEVELVWHGLAPPYTELFAWIEGRAEKPVSIDPAPFRPVMLSHAIEEQDFPALDPSHFAAEWKWDGIRVQAVAGEVDGKCVARLYSRTGEDISGAFPDLVEALAFDGAIDGELLILREGRVQSFNVLQQRLNRKTVNGKLIAKFPAHLRAYDLLVDGGDDLRELPFAERRARLEALIAKLDTSRVDISPLVPFATWDELAAARADPASAGAGEDAEAVEGVMLKRRDAAYMPGRPKGLWWKWKRDPHVVDAVLMYAQRGHGKRSSFYSDYTFGVWTDGEAGDELIPVGKAYFGFTDEELAQIDKFVRNNTVNRFGPVREVVHEPAKGLVLEVAFEGLQRSTRHKSGVAMRFPRVSRLRWDKPPREADRLEMLERMLRDDASQSVRPSPTRRESQTGPTRATVPARRP
jgi:DNA ligase-1